MADDSQPYDLFDQADFSKPADVRQGFMTLREMMREQMRREHAMAERYSRMYTQNGTRIDNLVAAVKAAMDQGTKAVQQIDEKIDVRDGVMMRAISRVEQQLIIVRAAGEATAAKVNRLEHAEQAPTLAELVELRKELTKVRELQVEIDKREAVGRAKLESSADELRRQLEEVKDDLTVTGQRHVSAILQQAADVEKQARAEADRIAKTKADEDKEKRDDRRYWVRWVLGIVGFIVTTLVTAYIGYSFGKPPPALPPIPSAVPMPAPTFVPPATPTPSR